MARSETSTTVADYRITPLQQAAASCIGAITTSLLVTPFDVIKTRLQAQQKKSPLSSTKCYLYCNGLMEHLCLCGPKSVGQFERQHIHLNGTIDAFVKISKFEGVSALWSGLSPTLVLAIPATILYFVSYEQLRFRIKDYYNQRLGDVEHPVQPFWIPLISGGTARVFSVTCVSPLELIRTKMQSERMSYLELGRALKSLVNQSGWLGLWRGLSSTLLRDVPFSAIYWLHYETIKGFRKETEPSFLFSFVAGALSGGIAATITVPFDVVKTHQQIEFGEKTIYSDHPQKVPNVRLTMQAIIHDNGIKGLFAGLVPRLVKVAPACAIMISTFEYGKVFFSRLAKDRPSHQFNLGGTESLPTSSSSR